jgi:hypothetical protein
MLGTRNSIQTSPKIMEPLCGYTCYPTLVVQSEVEMEIIFHNHKFHVVCCHYYFRQLEPAGGLHFKIRQYVKLTFVL